VYALRLEARATNVCPTANAKGRAMNETNLLKNAGVRGVVPLPQKRPAQIVIWKIELGARRNYRRLGKHLEKRDAALYRNGSHGRGLIHVGANGECRYVTKASQLAPLIVDTLTMRVTREGKVVSELPTAAHLNAMLHAEAFLRQFRPVDQAATAPLYLSDFTPLPPGYHDGGDGERLLYVGHEPRIAESTETIDRFLDVMDFATSADRTNTVAAALTVLLRHHWAGQRPVVVVTATKSQAGKGTITEFIRGSVAKADVLYESTDWPMPSQLQRQVSHDPEVGLICLDNVRLDSAGGRARCIRSGFVEGFVTSAKVTLASPGAGEAVRLKNRFVVTVNTNDGLLSPDLMNRALSIHLAPRGDVQGRRTPIGNPKLEFLPQNRGRIEAELRGMIARWKQSGCPLDVAARHPMTPWARAVGGILKANGYSDFLGNYHARKVTDDPLREAVGVLAAAKPGKELRPGEWAEVAVQQGLVKTLFPSHERDTEKGRERAMGVLLSRHLEETFEARTEAKRLRVRLDGGFRRWVKGRNPQMRYVFKVAEEEDLPVDC
jgi:hypothetical protein